MTAPESPASLLRRAAERLDQLAAPLADHGHWRAEVDVNDDSQWVVSIAHGPTMQTDRGPVVLQGQWAVVNDVPENIARYVTALGPKVAPHLSAVLEGAAWDATEEGGVDDRILALARCLLGETGEQP